MITRNDDLLNNEDIEDIVDNKVTDSGVIRDIQLCEFVHQSVDKAVLRARVLDSNDQLEDTIKSDYKMERSKVYTHLWELLVDGKGGPNESVHTKLCQLTRQEALHQEFVTYRMEKCLLSHYLEHTWDQRLVYIDQLKHTIKEKMRKHDLQWPAERLAKLPKGYEGLGDRGFVGTSTSYPHCNPTKTPCFLEGRDQYTFAETVGTRDLCQGRYGSEAYNKRTNDHLYIQDKIPRRNFHYAEDVLKWAMFNANLCQPFLMPRGAGDYFPKNTKHLLRPCKRARADLSILSQPTVQSGSSVSNSSSSVQRPYNYIDIAMPERYFKIGLEKVVLLMDGKDCVTDTVQVSSFVSCAQYSDKMHCSAAR